jgi:hypothetical protein
MNVKKQIGTLGGEGEKGRDLTVTITMNYNFDITTNDNKM